MWCSISKIILPRAPPAVNNQPSVANDERLLYTDKPPGNFTQKEVKVMREVNTFIEAIIASMIGNYVCRLVDDIVNLLTM